MKEEKWVQVIGWLSCALAVSMFVSMIDQAVLNMKGGSGSIWQPLITVMNCTGWTVFGFYLRKRNWQIIICNIPGIPIGLFTFVTAKWGAAIMPLLSL